MKILTAITLGLSAAAIDTEVRAQDCDAVLNTGSIEITQGGVSCAAAGITTINIFAKSYDRTGETDDLYVSCIDFGAGNTGTTSVPIEIAIYTDTDGGDPQAPGVDMVEIPGSRIVGELAPGPDGLLQVSYGTPVLLAAGGVYVVELFIAASADGFCSISGNTGPDAQTFIRTDDCGLSTYVSYASIGFPDNFWAQQLVGSTNGDQPCDCYTGSDCAIPRPDEVGCDDPFCESVVCLIDPVCCTDSWDETCAAYADTLCNFTGFECDLPTSTIAEAEPCGSDTNGGCNMDIPAFESIASGDVVAGTCHVDATADFRDTDWYQFTIDQPSNVTWTVNSRVPVDALIVTTDCVAGAQVVSSGSGECPAINQICLQPGTYAAFVAPDTGGGNLPCELTDFTAYTAELLVEPLENCPGFDVCEPGEASLSPNSSQKLDTAGIACQADGVTVENTYAVSIDLAASDVSGTDFNVSCVNFGCENSGSPVQASIQLWIDLDGGAPTSPGTDLELLGTRDTVITTGPSNFQSVSFEPPICVPADSTLVVTMAIEPSNDGYASYHGNAQPTTSPTWILTAPCGINTFTDLVDIGFPDNNWVVRIEGDAGCEDDPPCPGDFDGDGVVDGTDLGLLIGDWGPCKGCDADFNGDGEVRAADLGLFLSLWGPCP